MEGDLIVGLWDQGWTMTLTSWPAEMGQPRYKISGVNSGLDPNRVFEGSGATKAEAIVDLVDLVGNVGDHIKAAAAMVSRKLADGGIPR